jgi:DNA-binding IclR family transcriptional regulator
VGPYYYATIDEIRALWSAVSADPRITLRCLVERTGIRKTRIRHILHFLEQAGYLEHKPRHCGRKVRIPLV